MASGFGTYTSSTRVSSGSGAVVSATLSQSVNTTARTVTITLRVTAAYYRSASGSWTPGAGVAIYGSDHSSNSVKGVIGGTTTTLKSGGKVGIQSVSGVTYNNGSKYTIQGGKIAVRSGYAADWSTTKTYNYDDDGSAITGTWSASMYLPGLGTTTSSVSGSFTTDAIAANPSGLTITNVSSTYNSVTGTIGVSDWGGGTDTYHEFLVLESAYTQSGLPCRYGSSTSNPATLTVTNSSTAGTGGAITIKGASTYHIGQYASNGTASSRQDGGTVATPPAPLQSVTYTQTQGSSNVTVNITITGGTSTNNSSNTVTTYYRYSVNGGSSYSSWTSAGTGTAWTAKTASFSCAYGASVVIQAKQTYSSKDSEVKQVSFTATTGTAPSGGTVTVTSSTWNSVSVSASGVSYGNPSSASGRSITVGIRGGTGANTNNRTSTATNTTSTTATLNNSSATTTSALTLKGMLPVYPFLTANNTVQSANVVMDNTAYYLPPAPGTGSYTNDGDNDYTISYTGVAANNVTDYTAADLTRTVRYKIDSGAWTYVDNAAVKAVTDVTSQQITIPYQSTATVEAWMTYKGKNSTTTTFAITNTTLQVHLYGSVNGQSKEIHHLYGSVNNRSVKITKLYASVGGVAKLIFQDT